MRYLIIALAMLGMAGCTTYRATLGDAQIDMTYVLTDKKCKSASFTDPNGYTITIVNFGSETSQVVGAAITAALGGVK